VEFTAAALANILLLTDGVGVRIYSQKCQLELIPRSVQEKAPEAVIMTFRE
jgi:hypothetical protein